MRTIPMRVEFALLILGGLAANQTATAQDKGPREATLAISGMT